MDPKVNVGDFVWAKFMKYPPWPASVMKHDPEAPPPPSRANDGITYLWVYFFGTRNYSWIKESLIWPYEENKEQYSNPSKIHIGFMEGIEELETNIENLKNDPNYKIDYVKYQPPKKSISPSKRKTPMGRKSKTPGPQKKRRNSETGSDVVMPDRVNEIKMTTISSDGQRVEENVKMNFCSDKIGFLGIGMMGSGIVKNLITSSHSVNIWNRDSRKCNKLSDYMASREVNIYDDPRELVKDSKIIFSCLASAEVEMNIIQRYFGVDDVNDDLLKGKSYISLTTIDPESSETINKMIQSKGGTYLEVQVQGSREEAENGNLLVLAAGNQDLYKKCQSCFKAMGHQSFYLGSVGYASKVNLIIQLIKSTCLVGLTEGLALAERFSISTEQFMELFQMTTLANPYLLGKMEIIKTKKFSDTQQGLQYMQKDVRMGLELSSRVKQPMVLAAAGNEVLKSARRFGYDTHDVASIYMRMRH